LVGILVHYYVEHKRKQSDSVWIVKMNELDFGSDGIGNDGSPTIIGQGTFGLVLLAEYRGTQVAVKRVIPPNSDHDTLFEPQQSIRISSCDSWGASSVLDDIENSGTEYIYIYLLLFICYVVLCCAMLCSQVTTTKRLSLAFVFLSLLLLVFPFRLSPPSNTR